MMNIIIPLMIKDTKDELSDVNTGALTLRS